MSVTAFPSNPASPMKFSLLPISCALIVAFALNTLHADKYFLLIDYSGSMSDNDPQNLRFEAASLFVDCLDESDQIEVVGYADNPNQLAHLTKYPDEKKASLIRKIFQKGNRGDTDILGALALASQEVEQARAEAGHSVVVLLTDGVQTIKKPSQLRSQILQEFKNHETPIHTIALGNEPDVNFLKQISEATRGGFYHVDPNDPHGLLDIYLKVIVSSKSYGISTGAEFEVLPGSSRVYAALFRKNPTDSKIINLDISGTSYTERSQDVYFSRKRPHGATFTTPRFYDFCTVKNPRSGVSKVNIQGNGNLIIHALQDLPFNTKIIRPTTPILGKPTEVSLEVDFDDNLSTRDISEYLQRMRAEAYVIGTHNKQTIPMIWDPKNSAFICSFTPTANGFIHVEVVLNIDDAISPIVSGKDQTFQIYSPDVQISPISKPILDYSDPVIISFSYRTLKNTLPTDSIPLPQRCFIEVRDENRELVHSTAVTPRSSDDAFVLLPSNHNFKPGAYTISVVASSSRWIFDSTSSDITIPGPTPHQLPYLHIQLPDSIKYPGCIAPINISLLWRKGGVSRILDIGDTFDKKWQVDEVTLSPFSIIDPMGNKTSLEPAVFTDSKSQIHCERPHQFSIPGKYTVEIAGRLKCSYISSNGVRNIDEVDLGDIQRTIDVPELWKTRFSQPNLVLPFDANSLDIELITQCWLSRKRGFLWVVDDSTEKLENDAVFDIQWVSPPSPFTPSLTRNDEGTMNTHLCRVTFGENFVPYPFPKTYSFKLNLVEESTGKQIDSINVHIKAEPRIPSRKDFHISHNIPENFMPNLTRYEIYENGYPNENTLEDLEFIKEMKLIYRPLNKALTPHENLGCFEVVDIEWERIKPLNLNKKKCIGQYFDKIPYWYQFFEFRGSEQMSIEMSVTKLTLKNLSGPKGMGNLITLYDVAADSSTIYFISKGKEEPED